MYQYRDLLGRRDVLHQPLDPEREAKLDALEALFWQRPAPPSDAIGRERRRMARCTVTIEAIVELHGRSARGTIVDLGGEGLALESSVPVVPGDQLTVKVQDSRSGREYRFPAEVCWRRASERPALGVRFEGMPVELRHRHWPAAEADGQAAQDGHR